METNETHYKGEKRESIEVVVHSKYLNGIRNDVTASQVLEVKGILPTDNLVFEQYESYHSENNGWDAHTLFKVVRERLETDAEVQKRIDQDQWEQKNMRKRRYETYKKMMKEFEGSDERAVPFVEK